MRRYLLAALLLAGCGSPSNFNNLTGGNLSSGPAPEASFTDPTVQTSNLVVVGGGVYIAPFARLGAVSIGDHSDIQDNATVDADGSRPVKLGYQTILAHGCTVVGPANLGSPTGDPTFVGFNARVEQANMEPNSMVSARARLGPGLVLHSGKKILPGRNVTTQAEADDPTMGKVTPVTPDDVKFMQGVLTVNLDLAHGYSQLVQLEPQAVRGIGPDPTTPIHPEHVLPSFNGRPIELSSFPNRIIGDITIGDPLDLFASMASGRDSLRADEGGPFTFGTGLSLEAEVTVHALEHSSILVGRDCHLGLHSVLHGGEDLNAPTPQTTTLGNNIQVGAGAVVFRSTLGDNCLIGAGALVDSCQLAAGTVVPANAILINNVNQGTITW